MTIPKASLFPDDFDTDNELFLVHDALRVKLLEDYSPGDKSITVQGDITRFPSTGLITLTDQCNDAADRAITFFYGSKTDTTFDELELLPEFTDVAKPKRLTNVTQNVMAQHHNSIKDALIAIQEFLGIKGTKDTKPLGATMEGRINFLRSLVLRPRAWFSASQRVGIVPFKVKFTDLSFRNPTSKDWTFGDGGVSSISTISQAHTASTISETIEHTYYEPGIYDVTLKVTNSFGSDTITFPSLINARTKAPDEAVVSVTAGAFQMVTTPEDDYLLDHLVPGIIKSRVNSDISFEVIENGEQAGDAITTYTWKLGDDLTHTNSSTTKASYSVGGIYDIKIRVDTEFGAFRTTTLRGAVDIVERDNLFLMTFDPAMPSTAVTGNVTGYEFGLVSETFKTTNRNSASVTRNHSFLSSGIPNYAQQKREFLRNNGFTNRTNVHSGDNGTALVYWAEGGGSGSPLSSQTIRVNEYEGFSDTWRTPSSFVINRPWNWVGLNAPNAVYFLFGSSTAGGASTNTTRTMLEMIGLTTSDTTLTVSNFKNGAEELFTNVGTNEGDFSVTRRVWDGNNGYIMRNDGGGVFFRLKSFYRTEGTLSDPLLFIKKLPDIPGSNKPEGQLVALSNGVYFFNNTGEIAVYSPTTSTWAVGGPGVNSPTFRSLQDSTVSGYDRDTNTLVATSDNDRRAYLSYDYSVRTFLKFNEADLTFVSLISRPAGEQFVCGVF